MGAEIVTLLLDTPGAGQWVVPDGVRSVRAEVVGAGAGGPGLIGDRVGYPVTDLTVGADGGDTTFDGLTATGADAGVKGTPGPVIRNGAGGTSGLATNVAGTALSQLTATTIEEVAPGTVYGTTRGLSGSRDVSGLESYGNGGRAGLDDIGRRRGNRPEGVTMNGAPGGGYGRKDAHAVTPGETINYIVGAGGRRGTIRGGADGEDGQHGVIRITYTLAAPPTVTTEKDRVYRLTNSLPIAPPGGETERTHTPAGWQRREPFPTQTQNVYRAERTLTFHDGAFVSATAWGGVTQVASAGGIVDVELLYDVRMVLEIVDPSNYWPNDNLWTGEGSLTVDGTTYSGVGRVVSVGEVADEIGPPSSRIEIAIDATDAATRAAALRDFGRLGTRLRWIWRTRSGDWAFVRRSYVGTLSEGGVAGSVYTVELELEKGEGDLVRPLIWSHETCVERSPTGAEYLGMEYMAQLESGLAVVWPRVLGTE